MQTIPKRLTLVHQVEGILRDGIRSGQWSQYLPGEHELCRRLQVSRTTLRAALATLTRERWLRSARGYSRQIVKNRGLRQDSRRTGRVVLITGAPVDLMGGMPMILLDDLRQQLANAGFELEVHAGRAWLAQRPESALERLTRSRSPVASVLFSATASIQRWFMARGLPCVVVGSCHAGVTLPTIEADFFALGQHAARQFLSRGHRRIALILPALGMAGEAKMASGVLAVTGGIKDVDVRIMEHDGTAPVLRRRLEHLLQAGRPTTLLVAGAPYVMTVLSVLNRAGIRVPEGISVVSRDHEPYLDYIVPPLTQYAVQPARLARRLSRTVVALAQGGSAPIRSQLLVPQFIPGETLGYMSDKSTR
ncbi:substrate-binding domain-containing protein [Horticoccus sp. 23ND18S-11]|uniref:substrate-binding domain-containing protein n=1 Tax=Horticoccus sp. 23ND18S-11 TaxID=3391832 RepID=UPI0039C9E806